MVETSHGVEASRIPFFFMTRVEIFNNLKASRIWQRFNDEEPLWRDAFLLYNAVHGLSGKEGLRMNCNKCINIVREWLEKP
jgi:hypothetical protein